MSRYQTLPNIAALTMMFPYTNEILGRLELHRLWLIGDPLGVQADFSYANLEGVNLRCANLYGAIFRNADLKHALLYEAGLQYSCMDGADLKGANLSCANLYGASIKGANLRNALLKDSHLIKARLDDANLEGANLPAFQICPQNQVFTAYKKVFNSDHESFILKLEIQGEATNTLVSRRCRTSKAKVISAEDMYGNEVQETTFRSIHDLKFKYVVGEVAEVPDYNPDIRIECTSGIHFVLTKEEALRA